jgi:uncharacterized protein (TIGR00255 family)
MTGFGNASIESELGKISLDVKSLNSKNLDLHYNLNPIFRNLEIEIRSILTNLLRRGKVDLKINLKISGNNFNSNLNHDVIKTYIIELKKLATASDSEFLKIAVSLPNSIENNRPNLDQKLSVSIIQLVKDAVKELIDFRIQEGNSLQKDLLNNVGLIQEKLEKIEKLAPERVELVKERIKKSLNDLKIDLDLNRFEQELIYHLEKLDINEEVVRLKNHLVFFNKTINDKQIEKEKNYLLLVSQGA